MAQATDEIEAWHQDVIERSPISIWQVDLQRLDDWMQELRNRGVSDIGKHIHEASGELSQAIDRLDIIDANQASVTLFEAGSKEHLLAEYQALITPSVHVLVGTVLEAMWAGKTSSDGEFSGVTLKGRRIDCIVRWMVRVVSGRREFSRTIVFITDVTARKQAEDEAQKFVLLVENSPDFIAIASIDGMAQYVNKAGRELVGLEHDSDVTSLTIDEFMTEEGLKASRKIEQPAVKAHGRWSGEATLRHFKTKQAIPVSVHSFLVKHPETGAPIGLATVQRDITERKAVEQRIGESEARYRLVAENVSDVIWRVNADLQCTFVSPSVHRMLGRTPEETIGLHLFHIIPESSKTWIQKTTARAIDVCESEKKVPELKPMQIELVRKDGTSVWAEVQASMHVEGGRFAGFVGVTRDITRRKRAEDEKMKLEEQLQQSQKLEAIGRLAGGVAHDMNNTLGAIMCVASALESEALPGQPLQSDLDTILAACRRGQALTDNLLGFARRGKYRKERISIGRAISETRGLLERTVPKGVEIRDRIEIDLADVEGDPSQINNVLVNLAVNATDSMQGKGVLTFVAENTVLSESRASYPELSSGSYAHIQVIDTGAGMDTQTLERAFEPFFTTKPANKGTGLGLSMVYGIIKNHGGDITLRSQPGEGTTVSILLPTLIPKVGDATVAEPPVAVPIPARGTALVVDDERLIGAAMERLLRGLGYKVLLAKSGPAALDLYREQASTIDFVILDLMMPGMDGIETLRKLKSIDAEAKVLIASGHFLEERTEELTRLGAAGFLQKPFTHAEISKALIRISASR